MPSEVKNSVKKKMKEEHAGEDNLRSLVKAKKKKKVEKTSNKGEKEEGKEANAKKKVFDLPGQKRDPPEERDPLRIFYETLYQQLPHSEFAAIWMMEYGLLPREVAETVHDRKQMNKKNQLKLSSPRKAVASVKKTTKSVSEKTMGSSSAKKKSASKTELKKQSKKRKMDNSA